MFIGVESDRWQSVVGGLKEYTVSRCNRQNRLPARNMRENY